MKIGVLGTGAIAHIVTGTLRQMDTVECYAVASRSNKEKAEEFRQEFGFEKAYGSYEELVNDPQVELVYVCTPHTAHFECMMLCMKHGKPVISEKAFTVNAEQARQVRAYASEHHTFAAEALWPRYMPSRAIIQEVLDSGIIGTPNTLTANLSYVIDKKPRITDPYRAGGALLDISVYGLNFALMHFGTDIERVESSVRMTDTGVDGMETITLFYRDGRMAVLTHSIYARSDRKGIIHGDKGYIVVENINNPQSVSVYDDEDRLLKYIETPSPISGYEWEFNACIDAIRAGEWQVPQMPLDDSVELMELMDSIRAQWGLVYPCERGE